MGLENISCYSRLIQGCAFRKPPGDECHINYSSYQKFEHGRQNLGYSIKYVLSGTEKYALHGKWYPVTAGKFLVVNHASDIAVKINSKTPVDGLCFFVSTNIVGKVWDTMHQRPDGLLDQKPPITKLPVFFQNVFDSRQERLGAIMQTTAQQVKSNGFYFGSEEEFFFELASELCQQQNKHLHFLANIPAQKKSTRQELYQRLLLARDYIHDNYQKPISLDELAKIASISEFHFLRSFKAVFGESPYYYLNRLRLNIAKEILTKTDHNITELAFNCGFNEVQAFSKLFRKEFGLPPTAFMKNKFGGDS